MMIEQSLSSTTSVVQALSTRAAPMVWSGSAYMPFFLCGSEVQPGAASPWCSRVVLWSSSLQLRQHHTTGFFSLPPMLACWRIQNTMDVGGTGFSLLPWFLLYCCSSVLDVHVFSLFATVSESLSYQSNYVYSFGVIPICKRNVRAQCRPVVQGIKTLVLLEGQQTPRPPFSPKHKPSPGDWDDLQWLPQTLVPEPGYVQTLLGWLSLGACLWVWRVLFQGK